MPYNFNDFHTTEQLHQMRQAELERAIRSGRFVKYDHELKKARRKSMLTPLLQMMKPLIWRKK
ncbi:hypothetical protein [Paenibacillus glycanilyticus]|uniref:Uncharacterized protein n=1 Tax=Paenibacillus glycanilyticus TaxID=126569 RepID=A0ABQ6GCH4_9BACL|nr:hypothetical protein [Paenibacillus glycanilyticus]GLX68671.1 hypothetical protein MU1_30160 [Paenibacillus glycanilyticus]